jgi:fructokinase
VGEDPFGDFLATTLDGYGVPDRFVERDAEAETALAFVSHDADADRDFTVYRDGTADTRLEPGGVPDDALDGLSWAYVGGVMLAADSGRAATLDLARRAAERDCTVVFDPNARPELWDADDFEAMAGEMLELVDVVKATPEDLRAAGFEAESPETLAREVCDAGPHTVLLTLGDSGSFAHSTDEAPWGAGTASHSGYAVTPVDTTGAGDAFTAGAIAAFSDGEIATGSETATATETATESEPTVSDVLSFANAVAALTTTAAGAMTALPSREAVREFRQSQ